MSRNVTVTFANGQKHTFNGVPDDATPEQVTARAQQEFPDFGNVANLDGGRPAEPARKGSEQAPWTAAEFGAALSGGQVQVGDLILRDDGATARYQGRSAEGVATNTDIGGRPAIQMTEQELRDQRLRYAGREIAEGRQAEEGDVMDRIRGGAAAMGRSLFGVGPHVETVIDKLSGSTPLSYRDQLEVRRGMNEADRENAPVSSFLGDVTGGVIGAAAGGAALRGGGALLKGLGAARQGNFLQGLTRLEQASRANRGTVSQSAGRIARNTGRLAAAGSSQAGLTALANGEDDVGTEALIGGIAGPVGATALKAVGAGARSVGRAITPASEGAQRRAISRLIEEPAESLAARQAEMSRTVGRNVPLVAALRPDDYREVVEGAVKRNAQSSETAARHAGQVANTFMDRMAAHIADAGQQASDDVHNYASLVTGRADNLQTTLGQLRDFREEVTDRAMRGIRDTPITLRADQLDDISRAALRRVGSRDVALRDRIIEALSPRSGNEAAEAWGQSEPVQFTLGELDSLRRALNAEAESAATRSSSNAQTYRNASQALSELAGDAEPRYREVLDVHAANSRAIEGFDVASSGRRPADIKDDRLRGNLETPEGQVGRALGELFRQREAVTGSGASAIGTTRQLAERGRLTRGNPVGAADTVGRPGTVTENVGEGAADRLANLADVESTVLSRMTDPEKLQAGLRASTETQPISLQEIVYGASLAGAMPVTKGRFVLRLLNQFDDRIDPRVANNLTDMLFSQDAEMTQQALTALRSAGADDGTIRAMLADALRPRAGAIGAMSANAATREPYNPEVEGAAADPLSGLDFEAPADAEVLDVEIPTQAVDSPYYADVEQLYSTINPEFLQLVNDMLMQESGARQLDAEGFPIESSAGAIGIAQVMPDTGPEAAADAGVPWDEDAYYNDEAYNLLIGAAYLGKLLDRYNGDVDKALAAYNGGMGRVDSAVSGGEDWKSRLPSETQGYVNALR